MSEVFRRISWTVVAATSRCLGPSQRTRRRDLCVIGRSRAVRGGSGFTQPACSGCLGGGHTSTCWFSFFQVYSEVNGLEVLQQFLRFWLGDDSICVHTRVSAAVGREFIQVQSRIWDVKQRPFVHHHTRHVIYSSMRLLRKATSTPLLYIFILKSHRFCYTYTCYPHESSFKASKTENFWKCRFGPV